jgi:hypothetical protein
MSEWFLSPLPRQEKARKAEKIYRMFQKSLY